MKLSTQRIGKIAALVISVCIGLVPIVLSAEGASETTIIMIVSRGLRWIGENSQVVVISRLGNAVNQTIIEVNHGALIEFSFAFDNMSTPVPFEIAIIEKPDERVFVLEGLVSRDSLRVTKVFSVEEKIAPHGDVLVEFTFIGRFYTVSLETPVKAPHVHAVAKVDGVPVQASVTQDHETLKISLEDVIMTSTQSSFTVEVVGAEGLLLAKISGIVSPTGVRGLYIEGGLIESIKASTSISTGSRKAFIPTSILNMRFTAEQTLQVVKITEVVVSSSEIVRGNVPVVLKAFSRGSIFTPAELIQDAVFEATILSLNITKFYRNNETAHLPTNEHVLIKATAKGFKPAEKVLLISNETREIVFYLEEESSLPIGGVLDIIKDIITHQFFIPVMLGVIVGLLIVIVIRGRG